MTRLKGLDATFLYVETERMPMNIGSVQVIDVPAERRDTFFAEFKQMIRSRSHLLPYLTHRVENAPLQIDHPNWRAVEPDYDAQIEHVALPAPGDMLQLEQTVAGLHARPLDRTRPLWKIYYIDGLAGGRSAYFNVVHHACLDGLAGQTAVDVLTDAAEYVVAKAPEREPTPAVPAQRRVDNAALSMTRSIDAWMRLGKRALAPKRTSDAELIAPSTPLNRAIGAARAYALLRVSMSDVKAIGKVYGCSINDVFLTICGGALRAYLLRKVALPAASLIAGVPVSLRRADDRTIDNQVTMMRVPLATHIANPVARLVAIHASSLEAKALAQDVADALPADLRIPAAPWFGQAAARLWERSGAANYVPSLVNVVISNVPGPRDVRYSNGARMLTHFPVSVPAHGTGANITVQSYAGHFDIGITACAETMPDVALFRDDLLRAYIDMRALVLKRRMDVRTLPKRDDVVERRCAQAELKVA
jgi:WS/DGAT/MGAT family acyltransferase